MRYPEVDVKLLKLAQIMNGKVVTNDFNLNKVAAIKGVEVLNINELANTLKPVVLPGEIMTLSLVKGGKRKQSGGRLSGRRNHDSRRRRQALYR